MTFDILEEIEEITTNTNYIIEIYKNTSIICSGNMKYKINKSAKNIIDENCKNFGSTLKGRIDSAKSKTNFKYKTPIILSEQLKLVLFPIGNYENAQNAWFSLKTIANYRSIKNGKTEVRFTNGLVEEFDFSYYRFKNQYIKAMSLYMKYYDRQFAQQIIFN